MDTWAQGIADLDTPDYMLTFSGLVCTLLTLQLPEEEVDAIVPPLMDAFALPDDARAFIFDNYLPEASRGNALSYLIIVFVDTTGDCRYQL